jgi:hypothetical protein
MSLSPGTRVTLDRRRESPTQNALTIGLSQEQTESKGVLEISAAAPLNCHSCDVEMGTNTRQRAEGPATFTSSARHLATFTGKGIRITLWPEAGQDISDKGIKLSDLQNLQTLELKGDRPESSIVGEGRLMFTSLRQPIPIDTGDFLLVEGIRDGALAITNVASGLQINIRGVSDAVKLGRRRESLMRRQPTLFEHVTSRTDLTSYYAGIALLGSIILSVLTRLGITKKEV